MTVSVHLWADYVCPFCDITDELLDRVVDSMDDVEIVHHPHELRPHPTPTLRPEDEYLPSIWQRSVYPMAKTHGIDLRLPTISPQPYTELAFRGFHYANDQGLGHQYHRRLMSAFFRDNLDIGQEQVLVQLAGQVGLDENDFRQALSAPEFAERHRSALAESAAMDITVVPTIIIGERRINGVASEAVLRRAIEEAR